MRAKGNLPPKFLERSNLAAFSIASSVKSTSCAIRNQLGPASLWQFECVRNIIKMVYSISLHEGDSQDEEEDAKTVTVRMARPETDKAKLQRMSSFKYLEKKEAEEQWIPLQYYPPQHSMASLDRDDLLCKDASAESPEISVLPREYLKLLTPSSTKRENSQPKMPCNVLSMTQLKTMELSEQVKALLVNAKLMSFSQLCTLLAPMAKEAVILKHLQQFAVLVQGSWVVKSEVLYPEGTVSPNSGIPAVILCRGRDYILWRFTQSRVVVRKDIASVTKLPNEDIKAMLEHISRMRVAQGWEFLLPCDTEFIHKHPEVFKHFVSFWESKHEMLASSLNISKTHTHEKASVDHKDHKKVHTDGSESQETTKRAPRVSKHEANHAIPKPQKTLPNMNNNATESSTPMEVEEFVDTGDIHVTKQPLSADSEHFQEVFKRLQDFVCEKLHRTVLSFAEFKRLLLLKQTACPPGDAFCLGVSDSLLEDAILTSGATEVDVMWPTAPLHKDLHSRKLYAFRTIGDEAIDKQRGILLDMFSEKHYIKRAEFQARLTELTGDAPSKKDWALLQQDLLEKSKSKAQQFSYYLKGTSVVLNEL